MREGGERADLPAGDWGPRGEAVPQLHVAAGVDGQQQPPVTEVVAHGALVWQSGRRCAKPDRRRGDWQKPPAQTWRLTNSWKMGLGHHSGSDICEKVPRSAMSAPPWPIQLQHLRPAAAQLRRGGEGAAWRRRAGEAVHRADAVAHLWPRKAVPGRAGCAKGRQHTDAAKHKASRPHTHVTWGGACGCDG